MSSVKQAATVAPFELPVVCYLSFTGFLGLVLGPEVTPNTLDDALPEWMVLNWMVFLAVGGLLAAIAILRGLDHLEAMGLVCLAWASGLYASVLLATAGGAALAASLAYWTILTGCLLRLWVLWRSRRTQRLATALLQDETP